MNKVAQIVLWTLTGLMALLLTAAALLYAPPVQDFLRRKVVAWTAEAIGLQVAVEHIGLRFPLKLRIQGASVLDSTRTKGVLDTLFYVRSFDVAIQARPLLRGRVEVDGIGLDNVRVNSAGLLEGMQVEGRLGHFFVAAHGIDLSREQAVLDCIELSDARVKVVLTDTTTSAEPDTTSTPLRWKITLKELCMRNVTADIRLPEDSIPLKGQLAELSLKQAEADLDRQRYAWQTFRLRDASFDYGLALRNLHAGIDSVYWQGKEFRARLTDLEMNERSGLSVTALTGYLQADSTGIRIPNLRLLTPHSEINLKADARPEWMENPERGGLNALLNARIGKQDVLLLMGKDLPEAFRRDYPFRPLHLQVETAGNLTQMNVTRLKTELPGAFALEGGGVLRHPADSLNREIRLGLRMQTGNLNFLKSLAGLLPDAKVAIPDSMRLEADLGMQASTLSARLDLEEGQGSLKADARYDLTTEAYGAELSVNSLQLHHFLPEDSLYGLTLQAKIQGRGTDFASTRTRAKAQLDLNELQYGSQSLKDVLLHLDVGDSIGLRLQAGDLTSHFHARGTVNRLLTQATRLTEILTRQWEERALDHAALRRALPSAGIYVQAGQENPLSEWLGQKQIRFKQFRFGFGSTPAQGINGRTDIRGLRIDSLQLDTLFFAIGQDTARMRLQGGVINGPTHPQFTFRTTLTGEVRTDDAELTLKYVDGQGDTGILLGVNARPLTEGHGRGNGWLLNLIPEQPVIAYRRFDFADRANWLYLHRDMHVYAGVDMRSDDGIGFRLMSDPADTVSLQNVQVALTRFRLSELSSVLPYLPRLAGLLSVEGHYIQTQKTLQVTGKADVRQLAYEECPIGDVGIDVSWLPREEGKHYLGSTLTLDGQEIMDAKGMLSTDAEGGAPIDLSVAVKRLPLTVANGFIPDGMAELTGKANGTFRVTGQTDRPQVSGSLTLDSASVYVGMLGARYYLSRRPIRLEEDRLKLDAFSIYTTSSNPFTIDGNIDLNTPSDPVADLRLRADDYTLLNARRTRESLVYGKVVTDLNAAIKGPVNALTLRGSMHLLGTTNLTYVLTDSPLTVNDRLSGLVTFVSFADTTSAAPKATAAPPPGGIDMLMTVGIDEAVRLRADLSPDGSKYIELEGGGDLSLRYTPQGDMSLTGRYTLTDGLLKYSLPVIPLKEFRINRGSYVDWRGDVMNPSLDLKATEQTRASVAEGDDGATRMVDFDVSIGIRGKLSSPELAFDIAAPNDATVQNELLAMGADERGKQAIAMLATGIYLNSGVKGGGLDMGAALNSVLQSQINSLAGQVKGASISVGVEDRTSAETGDKQTDYSFRYAQRFFGDRVQIVIGGKVSTGAGATNSVESFIDNISLEYRLDATGTRYVRAFYNKNYESVLDGEITETGVGLVLRRKVDRLSELFIFRKKEEE